MGIWYTDKKPIEVTLRFTPRLFNESRKPVGIEPNKRNTGRRQLALAAQVAEPLEMILGFAVGCRCRGIEPQNLRKQSKKKYTD
jgi:hypothetical protein